MLYLSPYLSSAKQHVQRGITKYGADFTVQGREPADEFSKNVLSVWSKKGFPYVILEYFRLFYRSIELQMTFSSTRPRRVP